MRRLIGIMVVVLNVLGLPSAFAEPPYATPPTGKRPAPRQQQGQMDVAEQQKELERQQVEIQQQQKLYKEQQAQQLESMRLTNPKAYKTMKAMYDRQEAIASVQEAYRIKKFDLATARRRLTPLLQEQAEEQLKDADSQIASMKEMLKSMEKMKQNRDAWVKAQVDSLLGVDSAKGPPQPRAP